MNNKTKQARAFCLEDFKEWVGEWTKVFSMKKGFLSYLILLETELRRELFSGMYKSNSEENVYCYRLVNHGPHGAKAPDFVNFHFGPSKTRNR